MSWYIVDCEMNGPAPGLFSMISLGAVKLTENLDQTFYAEFAPISISYDPDTYKIVGGSYEQQLNFPHPEHGMRNFYDWIMSTTKGRPVFVSDNPSGDFAFVNYYFYKYLGKNPFGWSARRIADLYCGHKNNVFAKWKHLRKTQHTHHPIDDAKGNAEALIAMRDMGLNIPVEK